MEKKLFGVFSGTNIAFIVVVAMLLPTAIWGASNYSNVVIQNTSGKTVDVSGNNLLVRDVLQDIAVYPKNFVTIFLHNTQGSSCNTYYTVPAGKVLVVKTASIDFFDNSAGNYEEYDLGNKPATRTDCGDLFMSVNTTSTASNSVQNFGSGVFFRGGSSITGYVIAGSGNPGAYAFLYGYLIPASVLPAMNSADVESQFVGEPGPAGHSHR